MPRARAKITCCFGITRRATDAYAALIEILRYAYMLQLRCLMPLTLLDTCHSSRRRLRRSWRAADVHFGEFYRYR